MKSPWAKLFDRVGGGILGRFDANFGEICPGSPNSLQMQTITRELWGPFLGITQEQQQIHL